MTVAKPWEKPLARRVCLCSMCLFLNIFSVYSVGNRSSSDYISIMVLLSVLSSCLCWLMVCCHTCVSVHKFHKHTSLWYIHLHYMQYFHNIFLTVYSNGTNHLIGCGKQLKSRWMKSALSSNALALFCFLTSVQINKRWKTRGVMLIDHMCPWQFLELIHFCYI